MNSLLNYNDGYVKIRVNGKFPERFINLCLVKGICLWKLNYLNNSVEMYTTIDGFKKMRPILKSTNCSVKILKKKGLPFIIGNVLRYKWLVSCLIVFIIIGIWSSFFIWFISVEAPHNYDISRIESIIAEAGLKKGCLRNKVDTRIIARAIQSEFPDIRWVNVKLTGIRADVIIELRPNNSDGVIRTGDIIAIRDGYIEEIIVLDGTALVKAGDIVTSGETLVEGRVYSKEEYLHSVEARALVKSVTWYYGNGLASAEYTELENTGRKKTEFVWRYKDKEGHLYGDRNDFSLYKFYEYTYPIKWRNLHSTVEVVKRVYLEQKANVINLTTEQIKLKAENEALVSALTQIGPIGSPIEITYKYVDLGNMLYAEAIIKAYENITDFRYHHR